MLLPLLLLLLCSQDLLSNKSLISKICNSINEQKNVVAIAFHRTTCLFSWSILVGKLLLISLIFFFVCLKRNYIHGMKWTNFDWKLPYKRGLPVLLFNDLISIIKQMCVFISSFIHQNHNNQPHIQFDYNFFLLFFSSHFFFFIRSEWITGLRRKPMPGRSIHIGIELYGSIFSTHTHTTHSVANFSGRLSLNRIQASGAKCTRTASRYISILYR